MKSVGALALNPIVVDASAGFDVHVDNSVGQITPFGHAGIRLDYRRRAIFLSQNLHARKRCRGMAVCRFRNEKQVNRNSHFNAARYQKEGATNKQRGIESGKPVVLAATEMGTQL